MPVEEPLGVAQWVLERFESFLRDHGKHCLYFLHEVDKVLYDDYTDRVHNEVYLLLIWRRLRGCYYRSHNALLFDLRLMHTNAASYNQEQSPLVQQALRIVEYFTLLLSKQELSSTEKRACSDLLKTIIAFKFVDHDFDFEAEIEALESPPKNARKFNSRNAIQSARSRGRRAPRSPEQSSRSEDVYSSEEEEESERPRVSQVSRKERYQMRHAEGSHNNCKASVKREPPRSRGRLVKPDQLADRRTSNPGPVITATGIRLRTRHRPV